VFLCSKRSLRGSLCGNELSTGGAVPLAQKRWSSRLPYTRRGQRRHNQRQHLKDGAHELSCRTVLGRQRGQCQVHLSLDPDGAACLAATLVQCPARLTTFTYLHNFDCVDQPKMDMGLNGIKAQSDPNEMQTPICRAVTEPAQHPTGGSLDNTAHLYALVPVFANDKNRKDAMDCPGGGRPGELCGKELGDALIDLLSTVPTTVKSSSADRRI
jgi:hypothetical protein